VEASTQEEIKNDGSKHVLFSPEKGEDGVTLPRIQRTYSEYVDPFEMKAGKKLGSALDYFLHESCLSRQDRAMTDCEALSSSKETDYSTLDQAGHTSQMRGSPLGLLTKANRKREVLRAQHNLTQTLKEANLKPLR